MLAMHETHDATRLTTCWQTMASQRGEPQSSFGTTFEAFTSNAQEERQAMLPDGNPDESEVVPLALRTQLLSREALE